LVLVDGEGVQGAREQMPALVAAASAGTWWRADARRGRGVKLAIVGERAERVGADVALDDDELWVRVDVIEWDVEQTQLADEDGEQQAAQVASVTLQVTVADGSGALRLKERTYQGNVVIEEGVAPEREPLAEAASLAAASFLEDISPTRRSDVVRLDDSDGDQAALLRGVTDKGLPPRKAAVRLRKYLRSHENNAVALYNLGVMLDAQGKHDDALRSYDAAMKINTRDYYQATREGCARRAEDRRKVFGTPPAPPASPAPAPSSPAAPPTS
jgi:tetratricopeptide (TPR) repeat protein